MFGVIWTHLFIQSLAHPEEYKKLEERLNGSSIDGFDEILATYQARINIGAMRISLDGARWIR